MAEIPNRRAESETTEVDFQQSGTTAAPLMLKRLRLIEDDPEPGQVVDELQLLPFSKTVAETALGTPGPFTIGVYGEWGTGKTFILRQVQSLIDSEKASNIATVWFDAWKYEQEEHLIVPLLLTITEDLKAKRSWIGRKWIWIKFKVADMLHLAWWIVMERVSSSDEVLRKADDFTRRRRGYLGGKSSVYFEAIAKLNKITRVRRFLLHKKKPKIVLFIDDLDRCHPDKAVQLLQGIKLILAQPGFVVPGGGRGRGLLWFVGQHGLCVGRGDG